MIILHRRKLIIPYANTLKSSLHQSVISLMIDYCQCMELTQTFAALCAETESESDNIDRNKLSQQVQVNSVDKSTPILCALVQTSQTANATQKTYTPSTVTGKESAVTMTPERQPAALTSASLFHRLASPLDENESKSNERPTTAPIDTTQKKFGRRAVSFDEDEQDKPIANIPLEETKQRPSTAPAPAPVPTSASTIKLSSSLTSLASLPSLTAPRNKLGSIPTSSAVDTIRGEVISCFFCSAV